MADFSEVLGMDSSQALRPFPNPDLGDDAAWLRRYRLYGLSTDEKGGISRSLIKDSSGAEQSPQKSQLGRLREGKSLTCRLGESE
jgi:hypothetical protein